MASESVQQPQEASSTQAAACEPIDILFNEIDAVVECLQDKMQNHTSKRDRDVAYAMTMVLQRLVNELGRTAGVIA